MKLDVGCGFRGTGDVNCDLFMRDVGHRGGNRAINAKEIRYFVICDGMHLPFVDSAFQEVFSSHTIEHVDDPALFLRELVRVSSYLVTVICPHGLGDRLNIFGRTKTHINFLSKKWFYNAGKILKLDVECIYTFWGNIPFPFFGFTVPLELKAELRKRKP